MAIMAKNVLLALKNEMFYKKNLLTTYNTHSNIFT